MATMIPPKIDNRVTKSEEIVFEELKNSGELWDCYIYHSLRIAKPESNKREGEIDFLILNKYGLLILEVKGASSISISPIDKKWTFINKDMSYVGESPFTQASGNKHEITKKIKDNTNVDLKMRNHHLVAFPNLDFGMYKDKSPEWQGESYIDIQNFKNLGKIVSNELEKNNRKLLSDSELESVRNYLSPLIEGRWSLENSVSWINSDINKFTLNQYEAFISIRDNQRIVVKGLAGTGKTFIAIKMAEYFMSKRKSVFLLCYNKILSTFLEAHFHNKELVKISTFDAAKNYDSPADVLILDEAQDILKESNLTGLNALVKDGLKNGKWIFFMDDETQQHFFGNKNDIENVLQTLNNFTTYSLYENCRNPEKLLEETSKITNLPVAEKKLIYSERKSFDFIKYDDSDNLISLISAQIKNILTEGSSIDPNRITLLFLDNGTTESIVPLLESKLNQDNKHRFSGLIDLREYIKKNNLGTQDGFVSKKQISYSTIQAFKGMQNDIIFIVGVGEGHFRNDLLDSLIHNAATRAKVAVYLFHNDKYLSKK